MLLWLTFFSTSRKRIFNEVEFFIKNDGIICFKTWNFLLNSPANDVAIKDENAKTLDEIKLFRESIGT